MNKLIAQTKAAFRKSPKRNRVFPISLKEFLAVGRQITADVLLFSKFSTNEEEATIIKEG